LRHAATLKDQHMTPDAALRMAVYQEGQRSTHLTPDQCPYSDWRKGTWNKGRNAAIAYRATQEQQQVAETAVKYDLKPCPFCGGPVQLEEANITRYSLYGERRGYGVVCRNIINLGGTCCMDQVPSASIGAAVARWNMRDGIPG
jgi:hypothetical protein